MGRGLVGGCEGLCVLMGMEDLWMKLDDGDLVVWRHEKGVIKRQVQYFTILYLTSV